MIDHVLEGRDLDVFADLRDLETIFIYLFFKHH
jgi:hypothetical protein